jgi:hypothetical protein
VFNVHQKPFRLTSLPSCYFYQVYKVHIHTKKMTLGQIYKNGANRLAAASGARDCPMCTTQYLVPWLEDSANWLLSGFLGARLLKIIGLSGGPSMQRSTPPTVDCGRCTCSLQRWKSEDSLRRQVAPDCPVHHEDIQLQRSTAPKLNGRRTWHSPDCPVCPSTEKSANS